jgi:hypothetical protein
MKATGIILPSGTARPDGGQFWLARVIGFLETPIGETVGLGVDRNGRLHWNGKPIEIIAQHLDLTRLQTVTAVAIAICTFIIAVATSVQAWTAYHEWACKAQWAVYARCSVLKETQYCRDRGQVMRARRAPLNNALRQLM